MDLEIRVARKSDLAAYTDLLQRTYQVSYVNKNLGLTSECFSKEIFNTPDTQKYLTSNLVNNSNQKCWLAFVENKLVGSISIIEEKDIYELRGFYVDPAFQGKGIGKKLWNLALSFAKDKNIVLDIYAHNTKTIEIYKNWGFEIDKGKGEFYRHWEEWPKNVKAKCIYMRYKQ
jgi:ribosomal protein S18 acetylase RimI-like enzyme